MHSPAVFLLILVFVVGGIARGQCKECPTATKPHLTRCDQFYKCHVLPANGHIVWIPSKCDRGLVYETALELCVLPADDWECDLGDPSQPPQPANDQSNVFVRNDLLQSLQHRIDRYQPEFHDSAINLHDSDDTDNIEVVQDFARPQVLGHEPQDGDDLEASGDGSDVDNDSDGDHQPQQSKQKTAAYISVPAAPSVATHLQRLTQLIQSIAQAQQQKQENTNNHSQTQPAAELGPNDLNAFLAHHDIQSGVRHQLLDNAQHAHHSMASDGRIPADHQAEILRLQQLIQQQQLLQQSLPDNRDRRPTAAAATVETPLQLPPPPPQPQPQQIIVNRPGGSVLFSLPDRRPLNAISDQTLQSMLELSKQLLSQSAAHQQYQRPLYFSVQPDYSPTYDDRPAAAVPASNHDDRSTVIHNHIPITIQQRKPNKPGAPASTATETRYDSFGNRIVTQFPTSQQSSDAGVAYPPIGDQLTSKTEQAPAYADAVYPDYSYYPVAPHLSEQTVNSLVAVNTPAYPTLRPTAPASYVRQQQQQQQQQQHYDPDRMYSSSQISDAISAQYQQQQQQQQQSQDSPPVDPYFRHPNDYADDVVDDNAVAANGVTHPLLSHTIDTARPNFSANQFGKPASSSSSAAAAADHRHTIVHYGDTYMPYAEFAQSVAPLLSAAGRDAVEMITCVTGARQPSRADCAKYYVCHAGSGRVRTYVCPQYTAFNRQSRFCDARTYEECKNDGGAAAEAAPVAETVAMETVVAAQPPAATRRVMLFEQERVEVEPVVIAQPAPMRRRRPRPTANSHRRTGLRTTTTGRPATTTTTTTTTTMPRPPKPMLRRIQCTEPTKVRDALSAFNYFSCFKGADGQLKAVKQTCPNGLVFCARMKVCTSRDRCKGQRT